MLLSIHFGEGMNCSHSEESRVWGVLRRAGLGCPSAPVLCNSKEPASARNVDRTPFKKVP